MSRYGGRCPYSCYSYGGLYLWHRQETRLVGFEWEAHPVASRLSHHLAAMGVQSQGDEYLAIETHNYVVFST